MADEEKWQNSQILSGSGRGGTLQHTVTPGRGERHKSLLSGILTGPVVVLSTVQVTFTLQQQCWGGPVLVPAGRWKNIWENNFLKLSKIKKIL